MGTAQFRFYAELNDFLPRDRRQVSFCHDFKWNPSIKDTIEAIGVPHTEVDLILVNGESVDFSYLLQDGDRASVYPVFESIDITPVLKVRPQPLRDPRFVLDIHLGKLANYLRLLGFDTLYRNDCHDAELADISRRDRRILLTRDRGLLKRSIVTHGYCVRSTDSWQQLVEILRRFDLFELISPFRRCLRCNNLTQPVEKDKIRDRVPPKVREHYREFRQCSGCGQIYWKGTHYEHMQQFIDRVVCQEPEIE